MAIEYLKNTLYLGIVSNGYKILKKKLLSGHQMAIKYKKNLLFGYQMAINYLKKHLLVGYQIVIKYLKKN